MKIGTPITSQSFGGTKVNSFAIILKTENLNERPFLKGATMSKTPGLIYVLQSDSLPHNICKIGQTKNWIGENSTGTSHRKVVLQTSLPHEIYPIAFFVVSDMDSSEGFLQNAFGINNLQYGGGTEWFFIPQDYLQVIIDHSDIDCIGEFIKVNSDEKSKWLKAKISECGIDKGFNILKTDINKLMQRKLIYIKRGDIFCQGVFEDDMFIVLKGSIIASKPLNPNRKPKENKGQERNYNNIIEAWKSIKKLCKKNSRGLYVLEKDLDISNLGKKTTSILTQGLLRNNEDWTRTWKVYGFTLKELKEMGRIDYPDSRKEGPYRWLK